LRLMLELEALWHLWGARRRVARSSAREIVSSLDATSPGRRLRRRCTVPTAEHSDAFGATPVSYVPTAWRACSAITDTTPIS